MSKKVKKFVVVTSNKNKLAEINQILGTKYKLSKIEVPEIQSLDLDQIITEKAKAAFEKIKKPVLVEDISFEIQSLKGLPGPFVKFFLQRIGTEGTVKLVGNKSTKTKVTAALGLYNGSNVKIFKGIVGIEVRRICFLGERRERRSARFFFRGSDDEFDRFFTIKRRRQKG